MTDITELFSRDPMELTDENIDQIIEEMRKKRHLFNAGGASTGRKPAAAKKTAAQEAASKLDIDLEL